VSRRRPLRRSGLAAAALLAALGLSGCTMHPGSAAVVGGDSISASTVDQVASSYCAAVAAANRQGGASNDQPTRELRRGVLNGLIQANVVRRAAATFHVRVTPAEVHQLVSTEARLPTGVPAADRAQVLRFFTQVARTQLLIRAIGFRVLTRSSAGPPPSPKAAYLRGRATVAHYAATLGTTVDPRYGRYTPKGVVFASGSLSVPVSAAAREADRSSVDAAWVSSLPVSQTCG
jgi:hypothetical protein